MLKWIIKSSLQLRLLVTAVAVLLIIYGITYLSKIPVDILPEFSRPFVEIQTEALGLSATEVEALITTPLEADMLNGVSWVEEIRSESIPGLSSIVLIFESGTDIMAARQMVQERLVSVFALPNVSKAPTMLNPISSTNRCMLVGLTSDKLSRIEMSVLARWTILPRLMGVPGVANVSIWGYRDRQLQVQVDPNQLQEKGVTLKQVISTTGNALWVSPLSFLNASTPGTGGFFDTPNQRLGIRHILPITTAEELSKVVVEGTRLPLGEISNVVEDHQPLIGDALVGESPSLVLIVEKFPWANVVDVTEGVDEALEDLRPGLGGIEINGSLFRPATFIEVAISNITETLIIGIILILIILAAFFMNWRFTLISLSALIVSVIVALGILHFYGVTPNMMVFAGLIVALGVMIDDAIADVEQIKRKLIQNREEGNDKSTISIIFNAALEIRSPLIYATLILLLIVLPAFFLKGVVGSFWQSIAKSYIIAVLASFFVALTLTPALSSLLFRKFPLFKKESPLTKLLNVQFGKLVNKTLHRHPSVFLTSCVIALVVLIGFFSFRQESITPNFKEIDLIVHWETPPGMSQPALSRILRLVSDELEDIQGVNAVTALIGRAIMSDMVTNVNTGQLCINLNPEVDYSETFDKIKELVSNYPGFSPEVLTYSQSEVRQEISGTSESFRVYGEDWNIIRNKAEEIHSGLSKTEGITNPQIHYPDMEPTLEIEVNIEASNIYGLKPGDVRRQATSLVSGLGVGNLFDEQKVFDVVVWGKPEIRRSLTDIENLLIETSTGRRVPLKEIASIRIVPDVTNIRRESVARYIDISADIQGRSFGGESTAQNYWVSMQREWMHGKGL
jgi:Cu/Ag efflux pump CusA